MSSYGRELGRYSLARLGLFLATCVVLGAVGIRGLPLIAGGLLLSSVIGLFALRRLRDGFVEAASQRATERQEERVRQRAQLDGPAAADADTQS